MGQLLLWGPAASPGRCREVEPGNTGSGPPPSPPLPVPPRQVSAARGGGHPPTLAQDLLWSLESPAASRFCWRSIAPSPLLPPPMGQRLPTSMTGRGNQEDDGAPSHSTPLNDHRSGERGVGSRGSETVPGAPRTPTAHPLHARIPHTCRPSLAEHRYSAHGCLNTALLCAQEQMWGAEQGSPSALGTQCHQAGQLWGGGEWAGLLAQVGWSGWGRPL